MKTFLKKLPSFCLIAFLAIAISLTLGLSPQKVFATDEDDVELNLVFDEYALYSDGTVTADVELYGEDWLDENLDDWELITKVGLIDEDYEEAANDNSLWNVLFKEGTDYTYEDGTFTFYGDKIWPKMQAAGEDEFSILVAIEGTYTEEGEDGPEEGIYTYDYWDSLEVIEPSVEYYEPDYNRILPGEEYWLEGVEAFVENGEYPDGTTLYCEIINLTSDNTDIVSVKKYTEEGDNVWSYTGEGMGTALLTCTYKDYYGNTQTCDFFIEVADEVAYVTLEAVDNITTALPGKTITLKADGWIDYLTDEGVKSDKIKNYSWKIEAFEGKVSNIATITKDKKDPSKAVVKFNSKLKEPKEVAVTVSVSVQGKHGKSDILKAKDYMFLYTEPEFYMITAPRTLPADLKVGESLEVTPELKYFTKAKPNGVVVEDAEFEWTDDNGDPLTGVMDVQQNENTFTLTRLTDEEFDVTLQARDGAENEVDSNYSYDYCWYWFDRIEPWMELSEEPLVFDGTPKEPAVTVKNGMGEVISSDEYEVTYDNNVEAGTGTAIVELGDEYDNLVLEEDFTIDKADQPDIVLDESSLRLAPKESAVVNVMNPDELFGDITYTSANKKIATATKNKDNQNFVTVKALKSGSTTVTVKAAGDVNHNPVTAQIEVISPIKITAAVLTKTSYTYDGDVHVPAIKTVNKKKNLVEGVDYIVEWPESPVNAGTYTVKITGIEKYIGTVEKTFKINKAKQVISVDVPTIEIEQQEPLKPSANEDPVFTYKSSSKKIATVDESGMLTGLKAGTVKITITADTTDNYLKGTKTIKVKVVKKAQGLTVEMVEEKTVGDEFNLDIMIDNPSGAAPTVVAADKASKKIVSIAKDGKITALKAGTAKIKVSVAGNSIYATETVIVPITVVAPIVPLDPDTPEPTGEEVVVDPVVPEPTL